MKYLLDTAPLAAYIRGRKGAVARLDALIHTQDAATSILNYGEVIEGLRSFPDLYVQYSEYSLWLITNTNHCSST